MSDIVKNYIELGFGSPNVDFNISPYINIANKQITNHGFSSEDLNFENNTYKNYKDFNFGSKDVIVSQQQNKYEYEDLFESGRINIAPSSHKDVIIKNSIMNNPSIICTPSKSSKEVDTTLIIEKLNTKKYRVYNTTNLPISANYIASDFSFKKRSIPLNEKKLNDINIKIKKSLVDIITIVPKYETSMLEEDIASFSSSPGTESFDTIQYGVHNRFVSYNISGIFDITTIENSDNDYFSLSTPDTILQNTIVAAMFDKKTYEVSDPNDLNTRILKSLPSPISNWTYGIVLEENTIYYYWVESDGNWYYSFNGFPSIIEYT